MLNIEPKTEKWIWIINMPKLMLIGIEIIQNTPHTVTNI